MPIPCRHVVILPGKRRQALASLSLRPSTPGRRVGVRTAFRIPNVLLPLIIGAVALAGCESGAGLSLTQKEASDKLGHDSNPLQLRLDVERHVDRAYVRIVSAASDVAAASKDRQVREATLRLRIRAIAASERIVQEPDPRRAFLAAWANAVHTRHSLASGNWARILGDHKPLTAAARENEADVTAIGLRHFPADIMDQAKDDVEELARTPAGWPGMAGVNSGALEPDEPDLLKLLTFGLLSPGKGISDMPAAIDRFTVTADGFSSVVRHLPEQSRWQMELLLLEMETAGPLAKLYDRLDRFQGTIGKLVTDIEQLPAKTGEELRKTVESMEKSQAEVRAIVAEARKLAADTQQVVRQAREGVTDANTVAVAAGRAAQDIARSAEAWKGTVEQVRGVLADYKELAKALEKEQGQEKSPGPAEYAEMAREIHVAAAEVRALLTELRDQSATAGQLQTLTGHLEAIIDRAFIWIGVLIFAVFLLVMASRLLGRRARSRANQR